MKVDYLIMNGEKKNFSSYCKNKQVRGIQNKTNNIIIDRGNKSIFVI